MILNYRNIDIEKDKEYVLEGHCRINYECDRPWKRKMPYEQYRAEWLSLKGQIAEFIDALNQTAKDTRTLAKIIENEFGETMGYMWVPFFEDKESAFCFSDFQDLFIEERFRRKGIATAVLKYAESKARQNGAKVLRGGTGCENTASINLQMKSGFYQYRYEFEKILK